MPSYTPPEFEPGLDVVLFVSIAPGLMFALAVALTLYAFWGDL